MKSTITMGKAGRVVLPKEIRDSIHLEVGSKLDIEIVAGKIVLGPADDEDPSFEIVDGIMVASGTGPVPGGVAKAVREERDSIANRARRR